MTYLHNFIIVPARIRSGEEVRLAGPCLPVSGRRVSLDGVLIAIVVLGLQACEYLDLSNLLFSVVLRSLGLLKLLPIPVPLSYEGWQK